MTFDKFVVKNIGSVNETGLLRQSKYRLPGGCDYVDEIDDWNVGNNSLRHRRIQKSFEKPVRWGNMLFDSILQLLIIVHRLQKHEPCMFGVPGAISHILPHKAGNAFAPVLKIRISRLRSHFDYDAVEKMVDRALPKLRFAAIMQSDDGVADISHGSDIPDGSCLKTSGTEKFKRAIKDARLGCKLLLFAARSSIRPFMYDTRSILPCRSLNGLLQFHPITLCLSVRNQASLKVQMYTKIETAHP